MKFDDLSHRVIGCALEVHRELGQGLLESAYEQCLAHELRRNSRRGKSLTSYLHLLFLIHSIERNRSSADSMDLIADSNALLEMPDLRRGFTSQRR